MKLWFFYAKTEARSRRRRGYKEDMA